MNARPTIVTCFPIEPSQVDRIRAVASDTHDVVVAEQPDIGDAIMQADIFFGHAKTPVDWAAVVSQNQLKWIQSSAAGLDHCLTPEVIASDIPVSGCSALFSPQVAETAVALLLGSLRKLPTFFTAKQEREYVRKPTADLRGKTIGIVGFGGNGREIAKVLRPMAHRIIATDQFPDACRDAVAAGTVNRIYPADQIDAMLPQCDVVVVTLPLSDGNIKFVGQKQFSLMRPGSWFINVGRGDVIDQNALIDALATGHLSGAGIDVAHVEPIEDDSPLWTFDNVIITPHIGAQSAWRVPETIDLFCLNFPRFIAGKSLINWVDKDLGYPRPQHRWSRKKYPLRGLIS